MSEEVTPEQIRESRRAALLQRHADGKRLTGEEKKEIADLISGAADELPVEADSMKQAVAMLRARGIEVTVARLQRLKKAGSKAFVHGRVKMRLVAEQLEALPADPTGEETREELEKQKLRVQIERYRFDLDVTKKLFESKDKVASDTLRRETALRGEVMAFLNDLPSLAGLSAEDMHAAGMKWFREELCQRLSTLPAS